MTLVQFGAFAAGGLVALGTMGGGIPGPAENEAPESIMRPAESDVPETIMLDISEKEAPEGARGLLYSAAAFIMVSITGCTPKKAKD